MLIEQFTFQSGDIQIQYKKKRDRVIETFTFQSGDIQMIYMEHLLHLFSMYLHSNLVIFKCKKTNHDEYDSAEFTFQSGDIQICIGNVFYEYTIEFTFQSGDIQIKSKMYLFKSMLENLHSNLVIFKLNSDITIYNKVYDDLHSNLVIFKLSFVL